MWLLFHSLVFYILSLDMGRETKQDTVTLITILIVSAIISMWAGYYIVNLIAVAIG